MSAKALLRSALTEYADLTSIIPISQIRPAWHDSQLDYPQLTYNRIEPGESGVYHGDNDSQKYSTVFEIDVWDTNGSRANDVEEETKRAIRNTLRKEQYGNIRVVKDDYDDTEKLYRIVMEVTIYLDQQEDN